MKVFLLSLLTNPKDTTRFRATVLSFYIASLDLGLCSIHQPANETGGRCAAFSHAKCEQIGSAVRQRAAPSPLRRFALAFLLFPWERCSLSNVSVSVSFKTSSSILTNSLEKWPALAQWASFSWTGRKRERDVLQAPHPDNPRSCLLFFFFPPLRAWVILYSEVKYSLSILLFLWEYTGALSLQVHAVSQCKCLLIPLVFKLWYMLYVLCRKKAAT